ncbi:MAG: META domain-containing protein [Burkholderiaceae bacterium]|nr:META domain-containing protein [Burkholderiaceae bacterium]
MALPSFLRVLVPSLLALLVSACAQPRLQSDSLPTSGAALVGDEWVATQIAGVPALVAPMPRLRWASAEQIMGSGGCNAFAGRAVVNQGALQLGRLAATGRLCMALPQGGQEDRFFAALESARTVRLVAGYLVLEDAAGQMLARFAKP